MDEDFIAMRVVSKLSKSYFASYLKESLVICFEKEERILAQYPCLTAGRKRSILWFILLQNCDRAAIRCFGRQQGG